MKRTALFLIGCALIVALTWYAGAGAVGRALATLGPQGLLLIAVLHLPVIALMGMAWWSVGRPAATRAAFLQARLIRDAAAEVLPFSQLGGFAVGIRALSLTGAGAGRGAVSMFADLMMEFAAKLPYTAAAVLALLLLLPRSPLALPLILVLLVASAALASAFRFGRSLLRFVETAASRIVRRWSPLLNGEVRPLLADSFSAQRLFPCFVLHLLCWFFGAAETWVIFHLMGTPVTAGQALVIDGLANAMRTFGFFVPAAAGVQEGAYVVVCALFGMGPAEAVAFSLARRAREIVLGLPGLALWHVMETRSAAIQIVGRKSQPPA